jgi:chromosome segregation and condensation protein ScpB
MLGEIGKSEVAGHYQHQTAAELFQFVEQLLTSDKAPRKLLSKAFCIA